MRSRWNLCAATCDEPRPPGIRQLAAELHGASWAACLLGEAGGWRGLRNYRAVEGELLRGASKHAQLYQVSAQEWIRVGALQNLLKRGPISVRHGGSQRWEQGVGNGVGLGGKAAADGDGAGAAGSHDERGRALCRPNYCLSGAEQGDRAAGRGGGAADLGEGMASYLFRAAVEDDQVAGVEVMAVQVVVELF